MKVTGNTNYLCSPVKLKKKMKKRKMINAGTSNINDTVKNDFPLLNGYSMTHLNGFVTIKKKMSKKKKKKLRSLSNFNSPSNDKLTINGISQEKRDLNDNLIVRKNKKLDLMLKCDPGASEEVNGIIVINKNCLKKKKKLRKKGKRYEKKEDKLLQLGLNENIPNYTNKQTFSNSVSTASNSNENGVICNGDTIQCNGVDLQCNGEKSITIKGKKSNKLKNLDKSTCEGSLENIISHIDTLYSGKLSKKRRKQMRSKFTENELHCPKNNVTLLQNTKPPEKIFGNKKIHHAMNQEPLQNKKSTNTTIQPNQLTMHLKKHKSMTIGNMSLPIHEVRKNLVKFVLSNETSILVGETGCGKSTQVPQFLYGYGLHKEGLICITQPRKIAAVSLAKRVAEEVGTEVGATVGYAVRFDEKISSQTRIKFVTDGMLLREALSDPLLMKYQWIILDEAHERTVNTDILFGIVKKAQRVRKLKGKKQLRIIIMSATMDVDHFVAYFGNANAKVIEGRQHEINYSFVSNSQKDYNLMCLSLLMKLHETLPLKYGFLVFLTGQDEIELFVKQVNKLHNDKLFLKFPGIEAYPLYAQLPDIDQAKVFKAHCKQKRKVVVSTNIAETSLTIPDISVVIDSCHFKTRFQNPQTGFEELKVEKISMAQAFQRAGRAGRLGPGLYYSALTKEDFETLRENPIPEILKAELSSTYVTLLGAGVQNVIKFDFFDRPPIKNLRLAEVDLKDMNIISGFGDTILLSDLGHNIKYLPLKPQFGKILLYSAEMGCSEEILTIISLLSCESIYVNPSGKQEEAKFQRRRFQAIEGDHITFLNVYNAFKATTNSKEYGGTFEGFQVTSKGPTGRICSRSGCNNGLDDFDIHEKCMIHRNCISRSSLSYAAWCFKNYLNFRNLDYAANIRAQLAELFEKRNIPIVSCQVSKDPYKVKREPILKSLISGLFKNVARRHERGKYKCVLTEQEVFIHPGSVLFGSGSEFILFTSVTSTGKQYMNTNSIIDPQWIKEVCPDFFKNVDLPVTQNAFSIVS